MSSSYVRSNFTTFLTAACTGVETIVDITADFEEINDLLAANGLTYASNWVGLYFLGHSELPVTVPATNDTGKYREDGSIYIQVIAPTSIGCHNGIIARAEVIRDLIRGQRIGEITIDSVSPVSFNNGYTMDFEAGFTSGAMVADYTRDLDL
jgi:hypothetical protein